MSIIFDIYPPMPKPIWMKKGAKVWCIGEAQEVFTVLELGKKGFDAAYLLNSNGHDHGWESYKKLYLPNTQYKK